jgi:NADPH:quinone reductase-like Zn-dependent oxidoreductase
MKIPSHMSFEEAASLGTGIGTMGLALFHDLGVPGYPTQPATKQKTVLVYGGSTASGTLALQLLKLLVFLYCLLIVRILTWVKVRS